MRSKVQIGSLNRKSRLSFGRRVKWKEPDACAWMIPAGRTLHTLLPAHQPKYSGTCTLSAMSSSMSNILFLNYGLIFLGITMPWEDPQVLACVFPGMIQLFSGTRLLVFAPGLSPLCYCTWSDCLCTGVIICLQIGISNVGSSSLGLLLWLSAIFPRGTDGLQIKCMYL